MVDMDKTLRGTENVSVTPDTLEKARHELTRRGSRFDALSEAVGRETKVLHALHVGTVIASSLGVMWFWANLTAKDLVIVTGTVFALREVVKAIIERAWRRPMLKKLNDATLEP